MIISIKRPIPRFFGNHGFTDTENLSFLPEIHREVFTFIMEGEIVIIHPYAHKQETMKITNVYGLGALTLLIALPIASEEPTSHQSTYLNTIAVGKQSPQLRSQLQPPEHNQTMDQVIGMLGDPKQIYTIGQPVITRWSYGNMTVYFEGDRVLRTVVHNPELETTSVATQQQ